MKQTLFIAFCFFLLTNQHISAQGFPDYKSGLKVTFDKEQPDKFLRLITWAQFQMNYNGDSPDEVSDTDFLLRRARLLFLAQITDKFLTVFHIGLNNLSAQNMTPVGVGDASQVFLHDAWVQYNFDEKLSIGGGLHYFNGISRLNNQSTLNLLTLDSNRSSWATLGLSDQFARHIGVFAKGALGKFQYQVAVNNSIASSLDTRVVMAGQATYNGLNNLGSAKSLYNYAGYFTYHFLDQESNYLPYKVGSYLGSKKVFTVGGGFFAHPNGSAIQTQNNLLGEDVMLYAVDAFYDAPIGSKNAAITAYAVHQQNDYGTDYLFGPYGTGSMTYAHAGYLFANDDKYLKFQPYLSYATHNFDAVNDNRSILGIGLNAFFSGHHSKLTLEFKSDNFGDVKQEFITLQAMIYL